MARVMIIFEDIGEDEIHITFDSSTGTSLNENHTVKTDSEQLAALSLMLLEQHMVESKLNVELIKESSDLQ